MTIRNEVTDYMTGAGGALLADTMGGSEGMAPHIACHDRTTNSASPSMRAILVLGQAIATRLLGAIWIGNPDYGTSASLSHGRCSLKLSCVAVAGQFARVRFPDVSIVSVAVFMFTGVVVAPLCKLSPVATTRL